VTTGDYTSITIDGVVSGNTFTEPTGDGSWTVYDYTTPTPSPTPTATPPPTPTPVPSISPVPSPTVTQTPVMITEYFGEYSVPTFAGMASSGPYTALATTGCLDALIVQPVGGTLGQIHFERPAITATPNAFAGGGPNEPLGGFADTYVASGTVLSFTLTNLTPESGTGTFTLATGASSSVTGSATITGSETVVGDFLRTRTLRQQLQRSSLGFDAWRTRGR
jgi:hypothetical protein